MPHVFMQEARQAMFELEMKDGFYEYVRDRSIRVFS